MTEKLRCMTSIFLLREGKILLLFRQGGRVVNNVWVASAGGHFEKEEMNDPEACVLREMQEELGVLPSEIEDLALWYVTLRRANGEVRQNYYFFARLKDGFERALASDEGTLQWFEPGRIPALEMPFTAKYVMKHYLKEGNQNNGMYGGIADGEKVVFVQMPAF